MTLRSWIRQLVTRPVRRPMRQAPLRSRPAVEALEDRTVPAVFNVTTLSDAVGHTGVSLRDAIASANANADADTITFAPSLTQNPGTITLAQGALNVTKAVTITGPGANRLTVSANGASRVFNVDDGTGSQVTVAISGLTITKGTSSGVQFPGGGVFNIENLTLDRVAVTENNAWSGGGVANKGNLTILRSLIADNTASVFYGGGVISQFGSLTVTNSTVTGNSAAGGGGGIVVNAAAAVTVTGSTIARNGGAGTGNGLDVSSVESVRLTDTLIADNTPGDLTVVGVTTFTADHVLVEANFSTMVQNGVNGNIVGVDPKLAALADHGGPTRTMALLAGSPALNAGSTDGSNDQRGLGIEGTRDIGAFEAHAPADITLSGATVAENAVANAVIGTLSGTDPDSGGAAGLNYALVSGAVDNARFQIASGQLRANASFDFEAKASYTVRVRATDSSGLTFEKDFAVTVTNVNEAPTGITLSGATVAENAGADAVVGTLSGTDPDSGGAAGLTYALVADTADNALFHIANGQLVAHASFDFEAQAGYTVRVRATDAAGLTVEKDLAVTVTNVNEAPALMSTLPSTRYRARMNSPLKVAAQAGVLKAFTDPDGDALTAVLVTAPARSKGRLTLRPDGSFRFVPRPNVRGIATFVVQAKDATGALSPTLTFTIKII